MNDELNVNFLFATTHTQLLVRIANGEFDVVALATAELANRGLDLDGKWLGFDRSVSK